jgi:hypothetical protein
MGTIAKVPVDQVARIAGGLLIAGPHGGARDAFHLLGRPGGSGKSTIGRLGSRLNIRSGSPVKKKEAHQTRGKILNYKE